MWPHCSWVFRPWSVGPVASGLQQGSNAWWELAAEPTHPAHSQETEKSKERGQCLPLLFKGITSMIQRSPHGTPLVYRFHYLPQALGPKPLPHGPSRSTQHPAGVRQSANQLQFFRQQQISVSKLIHQNCNTRQVCQFNKVERKLVDVHRKHHRYWTGGPTCGPSQHIDMCTGHMGLRLMVLLLPLILLFHNG